MNWMPVIACVMSLLMATSVGAQRPMKQPIDEQKPNGGGISVYEQNARFWQYKGKPVMLLGANQTDSPYLLPDQQAYFDSLTKLGGNYTRWVVKQRLDDGLVQRFPYERLSDGRYDLDQWDKEYWSRFEQGLELTRDRDIVVQLELWDRFDFGSGRSYAVSPWRPANNINYTQQQSGLPDEWQGGDSVINTHPFFRAAAEPLSNALLLQRQKRHVDKVLSITFRFDHVLYVVTNESTLSREWSDFWAGYVREKAREANRSVEVSEMPWTLADRFPFSWQVTSLGTPDTWINHVINHSELFSFCAFQFQPVVSMGQAHYDRLTEIYDRVQRVPSGPRPINAVKVFASGRVFGAEREPNPQTRYWRPLLAGWAAVSLHREHPGSEYLGFSEAGQRNLSAARKFCDAIVPWECVPSQHLLLDREPDEAYMLANRGKAYGVYFPTTGTVSVDLTGDAGSQISLRWISLETGDFVGETIIREASAATELTTPSTGSNVGWAATIQVD